MEIKLTSIKCKKCGKLVENVGEHAKSVTCDVCVEAELSKAYKDQDYEQVNNIKLMKGGETMKKETKKVISKPVKQVKPTKIATTAKPISLECTVTPTAEKVSVSAQIRNLLTAGKSVSDIATTLGIKSKRVLDIRWMEAHKK
jgi:hypothetical protein